MTPEDYKRVGDSISAIALDAAIESVKAVSQWGEQDYPSFLADKGTKTWPPGGRRAAFYGVATEQAQRLKLEDAVKRGTITWAHIFAEEVSEAIEAEDVGSLRAELLQVAGVCINWVRSIDRGNDK